MRIATSRGTNVSIVAVANLIVFNVLVIFTLPRDSSRCVVNAFFRQNNNNNNNRYHHNKNDNNKYSTILRNDLHFHFRGGDDASIADVGEIESSDYDESESEDEEEEEEGEPLTPISAKLTKATQKAATKVVKTSVAAALKKTSTKKKKKSSVSSLLMKYYNKIPYIIRSCLNPYVFFRMTTEYWKSLLNVEYLQDKVDPNADLRSTLEQKAKFDTTKKPRGRKKMKPGQAKKLSDLPPLNT